MTTTAAETDAFLASLRAGSADASERFVRAHAARALAVARRFLPNESDAHEAAQDAFLSFFQSLDRFRGGASLGTWLHRIVVNAALMKLRARRRRPEVRLEDLLPRYDDAGHRADVQPPWQKTADEILSDAELRQRIHERIAELPEDYRNVLMLRDIEGLSTSAAAEQLGATAGAVKTRLHRARQALRSLLEQDLA